MSENEKDTEQEIVAHRYKYLSEKREHFLKRGRKNSAITIPYLMPRDGHNSSESFPTPYQSVGARGVNNLASKMVLAFLPPDHSVFQFTVTESILKELEQEQEEGSEITLSDIEKTLRSLERDIEKEIDASNLRMNMFEGFKHIYVVGNVLIHAPEKTNNIKLFRLDRYVCVRDSIGGLLELITEEELSPLSLSPELREYCEINDENSSKKNVLIYTKVSFNEAIDKYEVFQECNSKTIPGTYGTYPKDKLPWIPLRGIVVDGEDYGRSYVEEYYGDLQSLEGLTKNIVEASAAMSKQLFCVAPNSTIKPEDLLKPNNSIVRGNAADVTVIRSDKQADLSVVLQTANKIEERLALAFLLNTSIQRNGDRVTAEEIRYMAKELEDGLGGMFTTLTNELMLPLLNIILDRMAKEKKIPLFPKGLIKPMLTTGLASMGRTNELQNLQMFVQSLAQVQAQGFIKIPEVVKRIGNALNINMDGLIKTDQEIQAEQQQAQQMSMMQSLAPNAINQIGGIAKQEIANQGQQQTEQGEA